MSYDEDPHHQFTLIDIGAAGGAQKRWKNNRNARIVGFEPDRRAYASLKTSKQFKWINCAVGNFEGKRELLITRAQTNTSFLAPNIDLIESLFYKTDDFDIVSRQNIYCRKLDEICSAENIVPVHIKLDTQGTELDILKSARRILSTSVFSVEIEVEFLPLYQNQPLFPDIHHLLTSIGFRLMDLGNFLHMKGRNFSGLGGAKSNLVSSDALYFLDPIVAAERIAQKSGLSYSGLIGVCNSYGYEDYALEVLERISRESANEKDVAEFFMKKLDTKANFAAKIFRKINISDSKISRLYRLVQSFIPVRGASWIPGLGNKW